MNIIFFGNEKLATACTTNLPLIKRLVSDGHHIELIVINESDTKSRNKKESEIINFAKENNLELYIFTTKQDLITELKNYTCEAGVLAAFGKLITQEVIDIFKNGIINLHPSLLPKYRGPTPIESAILNGDSETGVSVMSLTADMDSGPIYSQVTIKLNGSETKQELVNTLGKKGAEEISTLLSRGLSKPIEQTGEPTICKLITKEDAILDLTKPAETLEREIRAYLGWPGSKTTLKLNNGDPLELTVTEAEVVSAPSTSGEGWGEGSSKNPLLLKTSKDYLKITKLKLPGKTEITTKDFLNGYGSKLN